MNVHPIPTSRTPLIGLLLVLTAAVAFSTKAIIIKLAYAYGGQVSPIILLTLRMVMSLPFFLIALVVLGRDSTHPTPLNSGDYLHLVILGVIGFYLAAYLDFVGLSYISASLERLVLLLYPTLVILLSALIFRRAITAREAIALIISYLGIIIVFAEELTISGANILLGTSFIFGSATAYALYLIGSGVMVKRIGAMHFTAYAMTIACVVTIIHFGFVFDEAIMTLPTAVYCLSLLMAILSTVIPTFLMNAGIQRIGANPAAIISSMGPVMTIFLAYLFLNEQLSYLQSIGALLVIAGVFVISPRNRPSRPAVGAANADQPKS